MTNGSLLIFKPLDRILARLGWELPDTLHGEFVWNGKRVGFVGTGTNLESRSNRHVEHHRPVSTQLSLNDVEMSLTAEPLLVS
jgi:hypothetical protein